MLRRDIKESLDKWRYIYGQKGLMYKITFLSKLTCMYNKNVMKTGLFSEEVDKLVLKFI